MKFHFEFDIKKLPGSIHHRHQLLMIGSCFTENIGVKLRDHKFTVLENPHGILFNPVSVAEALTDCIEKKEYTTNDLFQLNEAWHSWKHHSRFSHPDAGESVRMINESIREAHHYLKQADYLFITLGSSWIYTFTEKAINAKPGGVAANNHKAPADWFCRKLMTSEEVRELLDKLLLRLFILNPKLKIIFTISPVRHLREGVVENNRSKAVLITAVHQLVDTSDSLYYFPAYELVIDDLRDYRFYAEDLVHPNYHATQYVWEKLVDACMNEETKKLMTEIASLNLAFHHKPFNPASSAHRQFLKSCYDKAALLQQQFPYIDLAAEMKYFSAGA
jgi:hypothetical protein